MSGFILIDPCAQESAHRGRTFLRIAEIVELCEITGRSREEEDITKDEYDNRPVDKDADYEVTDGRVPRYIRYLPTTNIIISVDTTSSSATVRVAEDITALKARIDTVEFPRDAPVIVNRGIWKSGEDYQILDLVEHPDDSLRRLVAMQNHRAQSKVTLDDKAMWCQLSV